MPVHKKLGKKQVTKPASTPDMAKVASTLAEATSNLAEVTSHLTEVKPNLTSPKEEVVAPDVAASAPEVKTSVEPITDVIPQDSKEEAKVPSEPAPTKNPLTDFKEKMVEEESVLNEVPKKNYMWPILLIFVITILLLIGVFLYKSEINTKGKSNVVTPSPTSVIVTPEPTKTIDLTKYEIEILNGSEVSGEASRQKDSLEAKGFMISSIGNADSSDYTDTIIQAKEEVDKDFITKLKSVLNNSFTVGETEVLPEDSLVPVIVIIGIEK